MLIGLDFPILVMLAVAGIALDTLLGEMQRWHPLVGFGRWANVIERTLNRAVDSSLSRFWYGILACVLAVGPFILLAAWLTDSGIIGLLLHALLLYFCIGLRSLREHALPIAEALTRGDLTQARLLTARIVSRDTQNAQENDLAKAGVESLLENGNDAVFGTLFWFIIAGGPGALLFRLANTLDAMWGYRTPRLLAFGCFAARFDDVLNWIPARLTALSYVVLGATLADKRCAWQCWRTQAPAWSSPNAGPVMASGAGALGLALGGAAVYHGELEHRPPLGLGRAAVANDICRAWQLVAATAALWCVILTLAGVLFLFSS
ncbi:MAG: adenosylcobinamide-phosphate synthase CbiB [Burkholderiaceae bacterium]